MLIAMRNYAQTLANRFMDTPVVIRHRKPGDKDDENPYGDDTSEFEATTTTINGWFIDPTSASFASVGGMSASVDKPTLRVPVGTVVGPRDQITINGNVWIALDASTDETWPAMTKVPLVRQQ